MLLLPIPIPLFSFSCFTSFLSSINTYHLPSTDYSQSLTIHPTESLRVSYTFTIFVDDHYLFIIILVDIYLQ